MQKIHPAAQAAHAWLRGYSDGWFGKPAGGWQRTVHQRQYDAGYQLGAERHAKPGRVTE